MSATTRTPDPTSTPQGTGPSRLEERAANARAQRKPSQWPEKGEQDVAAARARARRSFWAARREGGTEAGATSKIPPVLRWSSEAGDRDGQRSPRRGQVSRVAARAASEGPPSEAPARFFVGDYLDCEGPMWSDSARPRVPLCGRCAARRHREAKKLRRERQEAQTRQTGQIRRAN